MHHPCHGATINCSVSCSNNFRVALRRWLFRYCFKLLNTRGNPSIPNLPTGTENVHSGPIKGSTGKCRRRCYNFLRRCRGCSTGIFSRSQESGASIIFHENLPVAGMSFVLKTKGERGYLLTVIYPVQRTAKRSLLAYII